MIGDPEEFRRRLEADPTDQAAFVGLRDLYISGGHHVELAELLEYRGTYGAQSIEAADLFYRAGEVWLDRLGDRERAEAALRRALQQDALLRSAVEKLDELYRASGDISSLMQLLEEQIELLQASDPGPATARMRAHYYQQIGEIWATTYERDDQAITYFHKAFELDRSNVMALYCAREIYQKVGDYENAAKLLDFEARAEGESSRRVALYRELAHARAERLGDIEGAIVALKRALALDPNNPDVMGELALMLLRRAPIGGGDSDRWRASELLFQVAGASSGESVLAYCEAALDAWPEHDGALALMEQSCHELGRFDILLDRYRRLAEPLADSHMLPEIYRRAGRLALEMGAREEAIGYYEALAPLDDPSDLAVLIDLYRQAGRNEELEQALAQSSALNVGSSGLPPLAIDGAYPPPQDPFPQLQEVEVDPDAIARLRELAQLLRSQGRDDEAEDRMREIIDLEPGDPEATSYLELRFRSRGDWSSLHNLLYLAGQSQKLAPKARVLRLREAAGIAEERLRDAEGAIAAYKLAGVLDPDDADLRNQLERLFKASERWDDLIERIEADAARAETSADKIDLLRQIADIHWLRRQDPPAAADTYRRILELKPDDEETLKTLDEIYLRESEWAGLVDVLERRRDLTAIDRDKLSLDLRLAAVLHEHLEQSGNAFSACKRVLGRHPDSQEALRRMEAIDTADGNWDRLIETLQYRAELVEDADKVELLSRAASVAETELANSELSAELWERVIAVDPENLPALAARARCLELGGQWEEALDGFRELAEVAVEPEIRVDVLRRIARLLSERGTAEEAAEAWQALLAQQDDIEACESLVVYFDSVEDFEQLVEVLQRLEAVTQEPERRLDAMLQRARVLAGSLGDPGRAVEVLDRILEEIDPESREALGMLRNIYADEEDFDKASQVAERELSLVEDTGARTELLLTCAAWYRNQLDDLPRAIRANERVLELDPYRSDVIASLEDLYIAIEDWERLLGLIRARYKASSDEDERFRLLEAGAEVCEEHLEDADRAWEWYRDIFEQFSERSGVLSLVEDAARRLGLPRELIGIYSEMAKRAESDEEQATWWKKIGALYASPIGDHARALEAVLRGFALDPSDTGLLASIDDYALRTGAHSRLVRVYEALIDREPEAHAQVDWRRRLARVLLGSGGDGSVAFDQLLAARAQSPDHPTIVSEIERAAESCGRWEEVLEILDEERTRTTNEGDQIDLLLRAAQVVQENLASPDRAFTWVMEAVKVDPGDEHIASRAMQVIDGLESMAGPSVRGQYWAQLVDFYRRLVHEQEEDPQEQIRFLEAIARIQEEYLDDGRAAFDTRRQGTLVLPGHQASLQALERLANRLGLWAELSRHYSNALLQVLDREAAIDIHQRRARVLTEELDRPVDAIEHYWQLIQNNPDDFDTRQKLTVIYQKAGRWNDLMMLLERELSNAAAERRREILLEIAGIWEYRLENRYEALDAYKRVLSEWSDDEDALRAVERLEKPARSKGALDEDDLAELGLLDDSGPPEFDDDFLEEETTETPSMSLGDIDAVESSPLLDQGAFSDPFDENNSEEPPSFGLATPIEPEKTGESLDVDISDVEDSPSVDDSLERDVSSVDIVAESDDDVEELDPEIVEEIDADSEDVEDLEPDSVDVEEVEPEDSAIDEVEPDDVEPSEDTSEDAEAMADGSEVEEEEEQESEVDAEEAAEVDGEVEDVEDDDLDVMDLDNLDADVVEELDLEEVELEAEEPATIPAPDPHALLKPSRPPPLPKK